MIKKLFFNACIVTCSIVFCASEEIKIYYDLMHGIEGLNQEIDEVRSSTEEHQRQLDKLTLKVAVLRSMAVAMHTTGSKKKSHTR